MKWLEVIHLRAAQQDSDVLDGLLDQLVEEIRSEKGSGKINLFRRAHLETDICLQLQHESEQVKLSGSRLGMHLAMALKKFGMVNHTVWVKGKDNAAH
jgi:hypothetical protein